MSASPSCSTIQFATCSTLELPACRARQILLATSQDILRPKISYISRGLKYVEMTWRTACR
jgi:hypothetical protein